MSVVNSKNRKPFSTKLFVYHLKRYAKEMVESVEKQVRRIMKNRFDRFCINMRNADDSNYIYLNKDIL